LREQRSRPKEVRQVFGPTSVQFKRVVAPREAAQPTPDAALNGLSYLFAKQVLSQLSYTPTAGTTFDFKAFAVVRKLRNIIFILYCVRTVSKPLSSVPSCVKTPDISLARRLILSSASLFICNFICEYFLNTCESP
jgi:hypothetical protein